MKRYSVALHWLEKGKIVVDCTNLVGANPVGAGLNHFLNSKTSRGETAQTLVPEAKVVKAFSISDYENFETVAYPGYQASDSALIAAICLLQWMTKSQDDYRATL